MLEAVGFPAHGRSDGRRGQRTTDHRGVCRSGADRDRRPRGPGGLRLPRPAHPGASGHPHVLAPEVRLPGPLDRRRAHPRCGTRTRWWATGSPPTPRAAGSTSHRWRCSPRSPPAPRCGRFIVVNPLLAGLGLYGFCRVERLSTRRGHRRGAVARDADVHLGDRRVDALRGLHRLDHRRASSARRATGRPIAGPAGSRGSPLAAFGWSQVATAHLSHGLVMCSVLVVAYLVSGAVADVRAQTASGPGGGGRRRAVPGDAAAREPRGRCCRGSTRCIARAWPPATTDSATRSGRWAVRTRPRSRTNGVWAAWPLALGAAPGAYAGAVILLAVPFAWRERGGTGPLVWASAARWS